MQGNDLDIKPKITKLIVANSNYSKYWIMKYSAAVLLCSILLIGCSENSVTEETQPQELTQSKVISIALIGNEQVRLNNDSIIPISKLEQILNDLEIDNNTLVSVYSKEDSPMGDLIDLQDALRDAEVLRINYRMVKS
jgi:biopolymer transport protein ExbD